MDYRRYGGYGLGRDYMSGYSGLSRDFGDLSFESAMNSLLARSRYGGGGSMPLFQPGGFGNDRRTWSLDPARGSASGAQRDRPPAKRPAYAAENTRPGPPRGNARVGAANTRSSSGAIPAKEPIKVATPTLASLLKLQGNKEAVIGLKYLTETITEIDGAKETYSYKCELCNTNDCSPNQIIVHIATKEHRLNYITDNGLEEVEEKDLAKRAAAIEQVHGRGKWKIVRDSKGLKRFDKSSLVARKKKAVKAGDIEMVDVEKDNKDPDLRDGDVVVDELTPAQVNEEVQDPKLVVLQYFDQLLGKDFVVKNETEAMIVDSIIQKLDAALFAYSKKVPKVVDEVAGEEENKNGSSGAPAAEVEEKITPMEA